MADLVVSKIKLPLTPMRHENRIKNLFYTFLFVIGITNTVSSHSFNTFYLFRQPPIINNCKDYNYSIKDNINKRLVPLKNCITPYIVEWKYATNDNFTHTKLYNNPEGYVRQIVAVALQKAQKRLAEKGLGLKFFDAYRPYSVTQQMWKIVPDERFAANPAKGSAHNRGIAVDVTLVDLATGEEVKMPTSFDDFSEKAHHSYPNLSEKVIENRKLLKNTMELAGFESLSTEWWHYTFKNRAGFELIDLSFSELAQCDKTGEPY